MNKEDHALGKAIEEGLKTPYVNEEEVLNILKGDGQMKNLNYLICKKLFPIELCEKIKEKYSENLGECAVEDRGHYLYTTEDFIDEVQKINIKKLIKIDFFNVKKGNREVLVYIHPNVEGIIKRFKEQVETIEIPYVDADVLIENGLVYFPRGIYINEFFVRFEIEDMKKEDLAYLNWFLTVFLNAKGMVLITIPTPVEKLGLDIPYFNKEKVKRELIMEL
jgi:hypothetical protein